MRNFDKSYMKMAEIWAENSYALRAKVGCIIVKDNQIISDGFNGTPSGFENECENIECTCHWRHGCKDTAKPIEESINLTERCKDCSDSILTTKPYVLHAEANAITKCAKTFQSAEGSTLYVTISPCIECAKLIIQAGIVRVVYGEIYKNTDGIDLLERAGIKVEKLSDVG